MIKNDENCKQCKYCYDTFCINQPYDCPDCEMWQIVRGFGACKCLGVKEGKNCPHYKPGGNSNA